MLARRSVVRTLRQPANVIAPLVFPMMLLAVNSGGLKAETKLPGLPDELVRRLRARGPVHAGRALRDDERGHRSRARHPDRLPEPPVADADAAARRVLGGQLGGVVVLGLLQAVVYLARRPRGRRALRVRAGGVLVLLVFALLISFAFGALGAFAALRTGSGEAVQGLFPVFFVFLFISSMNIPRNLMSVAWFRDVATANPVSYLIECVRSLIITGWDGEALALGFGIALVVAVVALRARVPRAEGADGPMRAAREDARGRRGGGVADAAQRLHEPVAPAPVADLPALLLHGVRGRARAGAATCRASTTRRATRRSSSCSCCCSRPRSAASSPASGSRATSRTGSRDGCCWRLRTASGSSSATAAAALVRWFVTVALLTAVAFAVGMQVGGSGIDLFGLYALGFILNVAALLWACGVAMRLRTMQAGPIMQMPVFLVLFFAPVYVPLSLLQGWIHDVAVVNPVTRVVEAGRGFLAAEPTQVAAAFAVGIGLVLLFGLWAVRGLRKAEAAG